MFFSRNKRPLFFLLNLAKLIREVNSKYPKRMKIVLRKDFKKIGKKGDVKEVADGFARNFLIAQKIAEPATKENIARSKAMKEKEEINIKKRQEEYKKIIKKIDNQKVVLKVKAEKGKLFGAISAGEVLKALKAGGIGDAVEKQNVNLPQPIKQVGEYSIKISFDKNITAKVILVVQAE